MTHREEWQQFHAAHPEVGAALERLAIGLRSRGVTRWGIGNLWEVLRYETSLGDSEAEFKLNNNHRAYYARWLMQRYPSTLQGFFEIRELQSA